MLNLTAKEINAVAHSLNLEEAYSPAPALFARVAASHIELETALQIIADQKAEIARLESEVMTDSMTGVLNKRGFMRALNREISRAKRFKNTNTLLVMLDMDGLKLVNDRYGHQAGDAYICAFARELQKAVRTTDYVGRLGGDEFALLLTDGDPMMMPLRVEAMMESINSFAAEHGRYKFTLRASYGMTLITPDSSLQDAIADADKKLYRHKASRYSAQPQAKKMGKISRRSLA